MCCCGRSSPHQGGLTYGGQISRWRWADGEGERAGRMSCLASWSQVCVTPSHHHHREFSECVLWVFNSFRASICCNGAKCGDKKTEKQGKWWIQSLMLCQPRFSIVNEPIENYNQLFMELFSLFKLIVLVCGTLPVFFSVSLLSSASFFSSLLLLFSAKKGLRNPLYTACPGPNGRQLRTSQWRKWSI